MPVESVKNLGAGGNVRIGIRLNTTATDSLFDVGNCDFLFDPGRKSNIFSFGFIIDRRPFQ